MPTATTVPPPPTPTPAATATATAPPPTSIPTPTLVPGTFPDGVLAAFIESDTFGRKPAPTATPFPPASQPFVEPTAVPPATGDLQPYFGNGQPIRVRNPKGGPFKEKSDLVVDFFITNTGSSATSGEYLIDLLIDGEIAQRWGGLDLAVGQFVFIEGGTGLLDQFQLQPGEHTLEMVIDPTDLVPEKSESNNTYSTTFTWEGPAIPTPLPTDRLPNLSLIGESTGIRAAPFLGAASSGGLSTNGTTSISVAILNDSPITVSTEFSVTVLFDEFLVFNGVFDGLVGGDYASFDWEGLAETVRITPGEHTLKLIVDPTGAVTESDETDNTTEVVLVWGTGEPIPAPAIEVPQGAPIRKVQVLSNLTGVSPYGWDAAISASNKDDSLPEGTDGPVWASRDTTVSFAVRNSSRVITAGAGSFDVQTYVDNELLGTTVVESGDDVGKIWTNSVTIPADLLGPGPHLVKMVIDSKNEILEVSKDDNSIARWFEFLPGATDATTPEVFEPTDEQLKEMLDPVVSAAFVNQVREASGSGLDLPDWVPEIRNAARATYYLLTGRDLDTERVVVNILPHDQFVDASFNACMTDSSLLPDIDYIATYKYCSEFRGEIGFKYRLNGKIHVFADLQESPIQVLGTYFHELGHALQDLENPAQTDAETSPALRGLFEAEAQIFKTAALRTIGEFMGVDLMRYPDLPAMRDSVEFMLHTTSQLDGSPEHVLGYTILWLETLVDTSGLNLDEELRSSKTLSGASTRALFDYLVSLDPAGVEQWVLDLSKSESLLQDFIVISLSRLEADLATGDYGNPGLREAAFLTP